ncbi:MAG: zinc ribbon domain-containing protein [candidate division KSB1 bacterium]|nr:zinc ribbon domain-containing protein [candidate division KSB1 bacterium]MDZ7300748.1 zinc ribbon domain-containing protein [candidate division KSB1 bacterium]MDZ7309982.1 zinc ribbon domain-containing protein [candidate division KSB1 bacterium]
MKSLFSIACVLLIMLWPQIGVPQATTVDAKIFCPQCGVENKPAAKFCLQCGTSLPAPSQRIVTTASKIDSTELARRELVRMLIADPEFNRMLNLRIQSAMREASVVQQKPEVTKRGPNPIGAFFTIVGGVTCSVLLIGLLASL